MTTVQVFLLIMAVFAIGGVLSMILTASPHSAVTVSMSASVLAAICGLVGAGYALASGVTGVVASMTLAPFGTLLLNADQLSWLFLLLISFVWLLVSVFSQGYLERYDRRYNVRVFGTLYNILFLSLALVTLAGDLVTLLVAWEVMTVFSFLLIAFEHRPQATGAAFFMLILSEIGALLLIAAFILLANYTGHFDYAGIRAASSMVPVGIKNAVFILVLLGFGVKVGLLPLHAWFPPAYAATSANVGAVLSGVTLSVGIYGLGRVVLNLLGPAPLWWGLVLLVMGALTAIIGMLYALMEENIKRMLSLSSVENTGWILTGLGAALIYRTSGLDFLAGLAVITALYQTLNHAVFKSLLFMGAGSVEYATGHHNMNSLGGLSRIMPFTTLFFVIGSLSAAGMPLFNGFVSEWLTLETLLLSFHLGAVLPKVIMALAGVTLAITAALAITCFVKVCGTVFLGRARNSDVSAAREVPFVMKLGMGIPAAACLLLGVLPTLVIPRLDLPAALLAGSTVSGQMVPAVFTQPDKFATLVSLGGSFLRGILPAPGAVVIPIDAGFSSISPTYLLFALPAAILLGAGLARLLGGRTKVTRGEVWVGGEDRFVAAQQYTGTAYSNPVLVLFSSIFQPRIELKKHYHEHASNGFRTATGYKRKIQSPPERYLYRPAIHLVYKATGLLRWIQSGLVNQYVAYMLVLLVAALIYVWL